MVMFSLPSLHQRTGLNMYLDVLSFSDYTLYSYDLNV